jgi:hypothetical protein
MKNLILIMIMFLCSVSITNAGRFQDIFRRPTQTYNKPKVEQVAKPKLEEYMAVPEEFRQKEDDKEMTHGLIPGMDSNYNYIKPTNEPFLMI